MSCCVFCQKEEEVLFNHFTHDMGSLCLDDYMKLHCSCGICSKSFLPPEVLPEVDFRVNAKFIGMGDKNIVVCDHCYDSIRSEFSDMFED
ncbi:hypothetical protein [Cohnella sp. AR92]|uniref:hypothetical protein n=1 Tax=Cohnella sp. AR92 TaxID=648716 RepID=UPI000F8D14A0|nr:hypothetical protein [Cohnella sp. AR92]RUS44610.1 hypothetical protein ELR57_22775 [Cohnella sp. AR92]